MSYFVIKYLERILHKYANINIISYAGSERVKYDSKQLCRLLALNITNLIVHYAFYFIRIAFHICNLLIVLNTLLYGIHTCIITSSNYFLGISIYGIN